MSAHPAPKPQKELQLSKEGGADWRDQPERSNMAMLRIMTWISLRLGRPAGRVVLHLITTYFLLFAPESRSASRAYLGRVLGRRPGLADLYRHIFTFAATIHDRVYLLNNRFSMFEINVSVDDRDRRLLADGRVPFPSGAAMAIRRALFEELGGFTDELFMYQEDLILGWRVAGWYGVDRWLLPRLGVPWHARVNETPPKPLSSPMTS